MLSYQELYDTLYSILEGKGWTIFKHGYNTIYDKAKYPYYIKAKYRQPLEVNKKQADEIVAFLCTKFSQDCIEQPASTEQSNNNDQVAEALDNLFILIEKLDEDIQQSLQSTASSFTQRIDQVHSRLDKIEKSVNIFAEQQIESMKRTAEADISAKYESVVDDFASIEREKDAKAEALKSERNDLKIELQASHREIETLQNRISQLETTPKSRDVGQTLYAVLGNIEYVNSDTLFVTQDAFKSAKDIRVALAKLDDPKKALEAIAEYAKIKQNNSATKQNLKDFFRDKGLKYAHKESTTTRTKYKAERTFIYNGEPRIVQQHITCNQGDSENCIQILFEYIEDKMVIFHCGDHLQYASQS